MSIPNFQFDIICYLWYNKLHKGECMLVTKEYLELNPNHIFVFGDNTLHKGKSGAAALCHNTYGFITKKLPCNQDSCFYTIAEYWPVFRVETAKLFHTIRKNQSNLYLISKLGAGLANRFGIFENIIELEIKYDLGGFANVRFLW